MEPLFQTKQEYVYENLRRMILRGQLKPGEPVVAGDVAEQFNVSSVPVREAVQRLKNEGLIDNSPHARALVRGMTKEEGVEIAELRLLLEPAAARSATAHMTPAVLADLERLLLVMDDCVARWATEEYSAANREFHLSIYSRCSNSRLEKWIVECFELSQRFAVLAGFPRQIGKGQAEHRSICEALKGGDADEVERLMYAHRLRVLESMKVWDAKEPSLEDGEPG